MTQKSSKSILQWATLFRGLGSPTRLRILVLLSKTERISVSDLADKLGITLKNTSRNLGILLNLSFVEFQGKSDHVYYSLAADIEEDVKRILRVVLR